MPKILHLATDTIFINAANYIFEKAFPECNTFLIVKPPANPPLKHIRSEPNFEIIVHSMGSLDFIFNKSKDYDLIVFHGLDQLKAQLFFKDEVKKKYLWLLWGAEAYGIINNSFLGTKTEELSGRLNKPSILEYFKNLYRAFRYKNLNNTEQVNIAEAILNLPSMGILHKEEFDYFVKADVIKPATNFIPFTYYPLEFIFKNPALKIKGNNILLGNSATFSNNHIEAIDILSSISLNKREVYIPLSYGNTFYAKAVVDYGKSKLPDNCKPMESFLPLQSYNELISNCGIVIMNHYRQQAVGNILASMYMGAKVFLNNTTVYQYLKRIGCFVYLIEEDLLKNGEHALQLLNEDQKEHNRQILKKEISTENVVSNLQVSLNKLFSSVKI